MKHSIHIMGRLSLVLLICVLLGQGVWLFRVRDMKVNEFQQTANNVLKVTIQKFLDSENYYVIKQLGLVYGLTKNNEFYWNYRNEPNQIPNISSEVYYSLGRGVTYDCLFYHGHIDINNIKSEYYANLQKEGILESPILVIQDSCKSIIVSDNFSEIKSSIVSLPVDLGHDYKHQIIASFELPFIFRALKGILWVELIFLLGFIICLLWQWNSIQMTVRSVRVQTMGMAHLEHELKKPLATMISATGGILSQKKSTLCENDEKRLTLMRARLMKMADITDTMLTSLKTSVLEIVREKIDLQLEMEMMTEMFAMIRAHARVGYRIEEGLEFPWLDKVYFNYIIINLVDNGIKYGGEHPVVKVDFYAEGTNYILTVEDNGMGIAPRDQKHIFKQFYRVKDQRVEKTTGFGLGLTFVHKVVCAYGGDIRLESKIGTGSKFIIILPQK